MSRNIPPRVPVITPIKLATSHGAPVISETSVPAIPKVASPAASGIKKNRAGMTVSRAVIKITMALPSDAIKIGVHEVIENGAVVPVKIDTDLPAVQSISIFVEHNPNPLIAHFDLSPECKGFIATRIKMNQPSDIIAIVQSDGKLYSKRKFVEVVEGGCG